MTSPACLLAATLVALLAACGGGGDLEEDELPCGWYFVGPLLPDQAAPGCAVTPRTPCQHQPELCI